MNVVGILVTTFKGRRVLAKPLDDKHRLGNLVAVLVLFSYKTTKIIIQSPFLKPVPIILYCILHCMYYIICIVFYVLYCIVYCIVLYCILCIMHCVVLYFIVLYVLYFKF